MHDLHGRGYFSIPIAEVKGLGLAQGHPWYYCVLPMLRHHGFGDAPRLGHVVGPYYVYKRGPGYVRGRPVGVVALR